MSGSARRDLLLTYYGDDFSGSTDVMESCARSGISTVLFLDTPSADQLARFPDARVIGIAGISRSQSPEWMSANLPPIFALLKEMGAPICQYKVCSTFDSSPEIGSIGRALDIGQQIFGGSWVPLVVGAPVLRRYTVFGNLFATVNDITFRIDRHPTMSRHPVTPMHEGDLRLHLSRQTQKRIGLLDILAAHSQNVEARLQQVVSQGAQVVLFDILDEASLTTAGRLLWQGAQSEPTFAVGSSGLEYALLAWWRESGDVAVANPSFTKHPSDRLIVVSGSCSPVTEAQIRWAASNGFESIPLDPRSLAQNGEIAVSDAVARAESALRDGRSAVVYTALGPSGPMLSERSSTTDIGTRLGEVLKRVIDRTGIRRAVVAGGDTSGHAAKQLDIYAVEMLRPTAPGSPLCRSYSKSTAEGVEIVFKGGQVGKEDFFGLVRDT